MSPRPSVATSTCSPRHVATSTSDTARFAGCSTGRSACWTTSSGPRSTTSRCSPDRCAPATSRRRSVRHGQPTPCRGWSIDRWCWRHRPPTASATPRSRPCAATAGSGSGRRARTVQPGDATPSGSRRRSPNWMRSCAPPTKRPRWSASARSSMSYERRCGGRSTRTWGSPPSWCTAPTCRAALCCAPRWCRGRRTSSSG